MAILEFLFNPLTLGLGGICFGLFLVLDSWNKTYHRRNGVPGPRPLPILGNMLDFGEGFAENMCNMRDQYGKVFGLNFASTNSLVVGDLAMLQEILISRFSAFPNHPKIPVEEKPMDSAINNLRDNHWRVVRNTLSPAFSSKKMKQMNPLIKDCCDQLLQNVEEQRSKGTVLQFKSLYGSYSMDVIASTFFGLKVNSQKNPNDPFVKNAKKCFEGSFFSIRLLAVFLLPWLGPVFDLLDIGIFDKEVKVFFHSVTSKVVKARQNGEGRLDMLQLMLNAHKTELEGEKGKQDDDEDDEDEMVTLNDETAPSIQKQPFTIDAIMANSMMFFLAGYETTNACLCFSSYLLATHPEMQERLIEEVDKFCPSEESVCYEVFSKMEYLDAFVRESLRIYPPVATADRRCDNTTTVNNYKIGKGTNIMIPIYAIHHDPDVWDNPEEFRPERFSKENLPNIHPAAWLPFGVGPRKCLGLRLALMEIKFALIRMLQKYRFETCEETEIPPVLSKKTGFICPPNGIKLQVKPRKC